jgi:hypothetical protein
LQHIAKSLTKEGSKITTENQIAIYVGIHEWINDDINNGCTNIGIQTEQLFDVNQKKLRGYTSSLLTKFYLNKFDYIIDLSDLNKPGYSLSKSEVNRVIFGPYIFSHRDKHCKERGCKANSSKLLFIGKPNERRNNILKEYYSTNDYELINGLFFNDLDEKIQESTGLINIHYEDGIYTEWPRLLLAFENNKITYSEKLSAPLKLGYHYADLVRPIKPSEERKIFENFESDIASKHQFKNLINNNKWEKKIGLSNQALKTTTKLLMGISSRLF